MLSEFKTIRGHDSASARLKTRRLMAVLAISTLILTIGAAAGYVAFLNHTVVQNVRHAGLLPSDSDLGSGSGSGSADGPSKDPRAGSAENVLVIGSDSRAGLAGGRSDVIILMHIDKHQSKVDLIHFPRDLYVDIPGHGKNKINAAYAFGGAPLLVRTVQTLVSVPIDHVAVMGFDGFKAMTDAVGGVNVYAEEPSTGIHQGYNLLNGAQALTFVRERHQLSQGDISRGRRQQAFIKALMLKGLSRATLGNPIRLARFISAGTKNLTVDRGFSVADMRSQAFKLGGLRGSDITFITAPITRFGRSPAGASIDILDVSKMRLLSNALRTDEMTGYPISAASTPSG